MILYRPMSQAELDLVIASGWKAFPPRLPEQPIFYPVLNLKYAQEVHRWNQDGGVVRFEVDDTYVSKFPVQCVGASYHTELWVPAEELDEFNQHIVGLIELAE
jgi:hypothetical protein